MSDVKAIPAMFAIPTEKVKPGRNMRKDLSDVDELAMSIKEHGQEEPVTVHPCPDGTYEIHEGHRRLAAIQKIKRPFILAVVRQRFGDAEAIEKQVTIHAQRQAFNPMDEAWAFHELMWKHNRNREQIARRIGKRPEYVRDRIALTKLTEDEQRQVRTGRLPISSALAILAQRRAERDGQQDTARPGGASRPARGAKGSGPAQKKTKTHTRAAAAESGEPTVIALCGAPCFEDAFRDAARRLALAGHPVLTPPFPAGGDTPVTPRQLGVLRTVQQRMIALADEVLVINPEGRHGADTAEDIRYAKQLGKPVSYLVADAVPATA